MKKKIGFLLITFFCLGSSIYAQTPGRDFLRNQIKEWGECKNVAMTKSGGDVALFRSNGWAAQGAPLAMTNKLKELNKNNEDIREIVLTEDGSWLILWGDNGINSNGIPPSLYKKLKKWNSEGEQITSITCNDQGDWVVISKNKYSASSEKIMEQLKSGEEKNGELWAAHLTEDGLVACYEKGYNFMGNVPENLKLKLKDTSINVFRIKFLSDGAYFFSDLKGNFAYFM